MARSPILTGARVAVYVNGVMFGRVSSFRYASDTPRREIRGVDSVIPFELAMTISKVSGSMTVYRLSQDGAAEGAGIVSPLDELTREKYFSIVLIDLVSNTAIFRADMCSAESQTWSFDAKSMVQGTINFTGLTYRNETRPVG